MRSSIHDIDAKTVFKKLVSYDYFPERLEGILSAEQFGSHVLRIGKKVPVVKNGAFQLMSYKITRNNNAPRYLHIPHPIAYLKLCENICQTWDKIRSVFPKNYTSNSMISPRADNKNRRLISMASYDKEPAEETLVLKKQIGKKYYVHADISNCFPSIYSHSIPWALVGKDQSKRNRSPNIWFNAIDAAVRNCQHQETLGLPIGPGTSNLLSEIILSQIDRGLVEKYDYIRHIDDFRYYCENRETAERFIVDLTAELEGFRLKLNTKKTKILKLPKPLDDQWVRKLREFSFKKDRGKISFDKHQTSKALDFLDLAVDLTEANQDDSALRYAVRVMARGAYLDYDCFRSVFLRTCHLCFLYPYITDCLEDLWRSGRAFAEQKELKGIRKDFINSLLNEHVAYRRSDATVFAFSLSLKHSIKIDAFDSIVVSLTEQADFLPLMMAFLYAKKMKKNIKPLMAMLEDHKTDADERWLFNYEIFRIENIKDDHFGNGRYQFFKNLRDNKISFLSNELQLAIQR